MVVNVDGNKQQLVTIEGGRAVLMVGHDGSDEGLANTALCAAAPELLTSLRDILAAYHGLTLGRQDTEWEGKFKVAARAAIAKAQGGGK